MIDFEDIIFISSASGFKRSSGINVAFNVTSVNITAGTVVYFTLTTPMDNEDAISMCQVQFDGLDSFWRQVDGYTFAEYPSAASSNYEIGVVSYFTGSEHKLFVYIVNQTGVTQLVPAWILRLKLSVYDTPFA